MQECIHKLTQKYICMIKKLYEIEKNNTILIGTPHITNIKSILQNPNFIDNYDETILTYLKKISSDKRRKLYDIINMPIVENNDFYNDTEEILKKQLNMQEGVKKLKLERR